MPGLEAGQKLTSGTTPGEVADKIGKGNIKGAAKLAAVAGTAGAMAALGIPPPVSVVVAGAVIGALSGAISGVFGGKSYAYLKGRRERIFARGAQIQTLAKKFNLESELFQMKNFGEKHNQPAPTEISKNGIGYDWFFSHLNYYETHTKLHAPTHAATEAVFNSDSATLMKLAATKLALKKLRDKAAPGKRGVSLAVAYQHTKKTEAKIAKKETTTNRTAIGAGGGALVGLAVAGPIGALIGAGVGAIAGRIA